MDNQQRETRSQEAGGMAQGVMAPPRATLSVALMPRSLPVNKFIDLFSSSIERTGHKTTEFTWGLGHGWSADVVILHWPDQFFEKRNLFGSLKSYAKLYMLRAARMLKGQRVVWVAHNVVPHDTSAIDARLRDRFFDCLDGIIFLSHCSRQLVEQSYPGLRRKQGLLTVHGHYKDVALSPPTPYRAPQGKARLGYVGLIRPYKNLDTLISAAATLPDLLSLSVSGKVGKDGDALLGDLQARAAGGAHIALDARPSPLDDAEMEQLIDACDGVVLPYRAILNSGSALHALSRNRPVLAPRIGSLPELQQSVGEDWLYLYDGELTPEVLREFVERLKTPGRGAVAPLDAYGWAKIGDEIDGFLRKIVASP